MRIIYPSILLAAFALTACGGGGGGDGQNGGGKPPPTTSPSTPQPQDPPGTPDPTPPAATGGLIEYYGDSTVYGVDGNTGGRAQRTAPDVFRDQLPAKYTVNNEGVSRTTACQLLEGDGVHQPWPSQMAASTAAYVIINHAINDNGAYDLAQYTSCLTQLAREAKGRGKQVIFETPNPIRGGDLSEHVGAMKQVAQQESLLVIDQFQYLQNQIAQGTRTIDDIVPDGLHPSEEVYGDKGRFAATVFLQRYP